MRKKLRIAYMGTPDFSVVALKTLMDCEHDLVCVYTQPPRPKGRGQQVQKSAVHLCAEEAGIEVRYPLHFKNLEDIQNFLDLNLDIAVVAAYGLILPESILKAPKHGCINIHASLLPRWRGAAPIQRAIMAGDKKSGVTIMQMEKGLDTGPEILKRDVEVTDKTTASMLHDDLAQMGAQMIAEVIKTLAQEGCLTSAAQDSDGVTYAHMLKKEEGKIDWLQTAIKIDRQIRALNPWPGTWCDTEQNKRLKVVEATIIDDIFSYDTGSVLDRGVVVCGDKKGIQLIRVQPENKKTMDVTSAINGGYLNIGKRLK